MSRPQYVYRKKADISIHKEWFQINHKKKFLPSYTSNDKNENKNKRECERKKNKTN